MKKVKWYRLALFYTYFNNGYGVTSPIKWGIGIFGLTSLDVSTTMMGFGIYLFLCFFFGWIYIKSGFLEAMQEVGNRHNLLAKEIRNSKLFGSPNKQKSLNKNCS